MFTHSQWAFLKHVTIQTRLEWETEKERYTWTMGSVVGGGGGGKF